MVYGELIKLKRFNISLKEKKMFEIVDSAPQNAVIKVIGVGGGG